MSVVLACVKPIALGEPRVERGQPVTEGLPWGLPAGERRALAAAVACAQALGAEPVALALGPAAAEPGLREALALGARRAFLVQADARLDALATARALSAAGRRIGSLAAVVVADASGDAQHGLVGPMLAELLGLDHLGRVAALRATGAALEVHRALPGADERWRAEPPVVLGISPAFQPAPHATSWGIGNAYALPLARWDLKDLGLADADLQPAAETRAFARSDRARADAERFEGDADEAAAQLARRLRTAGVAR